MSSSEEDFGELDFVSTASSSVMEHWKNGVLNTQATGGLESSSPIKPDQSIVTPPNPPKVRKVGGKRAVEPQRGGRMREELDESTDKENSFVVDGSKTNVTPPSSPKQQTTGRKERAVRGAARTKKTQQALKIIENKSKKAPTKSGGRSRRPPSAELQGQADAAVEDIEIDDDAFEIKVKWKTDIMRIQVIEEERMGLVMDRVAERVGHNPGDIGLQHHIESGTAGVETEVKWIPRETSVAGLDLKISSILIARLRDNLKPEESDLIELKVQTKDKRSSVMIKVKKLDKMELVMDKFCELKNVQKDTLRFFFDGEELDPAETSESLDLEGGECIDVHEK